MTAPKPGVSPSAPFLARMQTQTVRTDVGLLNVSVVQERRSRDAVVVMQRPQKSKRELLDQKARTYADFCRSRC